MLVNIVKTKKTYAFFLSQLRSDILELLQEENTAHKISNKNGRTYDKKRTVNQILI